MGYTLQMPFCGFPRYLEWEHLDGVFWLKLECPQEHFLPGGALHALWKQTTRCEIQQAKTCTTPGVGEGSPHQCGQCHSLVSGTGRNTA